MQEWSDSVRIAVDVFVACVLISAMLTVMTIAGKITNLVDNNRAAADSVKDYRIAAAYEGTEVMPQDIINLILEDRGYPSVTVDFKPTRANLSQPLGTEDLEYSMTRNSSAYTTSAVTNKMHMSSRYKCTLEWNRDGSLKGYSFKEL